MHTYVIITLHLRKRLGKYVQLYSTYTCTVYTCLLYMYIANEYTVEPPIKDTIQKKLYIKDKFPCPK